MRWLLFFFLPLSLSLTGCLSIAWQGYKKPIDSDFETIRCIRIGRQNLNLLQWQAIKEATGDVCDVLSDPEFKQRLLSKSWLASCEKVKGKMDTISGQEVYQILTNHVYQYSIHPHKPWKAEGQAETDLLKPEDNRIAIDPMAIDGWFSTVDTIRSNLINIIVHETVHIISERFLDYDGYGSAACPDSQLLSYALGDLAEEIWLKRHRK